jgi:enamine deaminase RidA (YjgF/YER057c/UK114 family)
MEREGYVMSAESKLEQLQLNLPAPPKPAGLYRPALIVGDLCYVSGHGPLRVDGTFITGRVGDDLSRDAGYEAARQTGLAILATLKSTLGSLDRVRRVVKILGLVRCTPDFDQQPAVVNGCSELMAEVFGPEAGVGARSAVGLHALPAGIAVEIEAIFQIS